MHIRFKTNFIIKTVLNEFVFIGLINSYEKFYLGSKIHFSYLTQENAHTLYLLENMCRVAGVPFFNKREKKYIYYAENISWTKNTVYKI